METTYTSARAREGRGVLLIALAAVLWGTVGIATRGLYALYATTPLSIGLMRLALSVPALAAACWLMLGRRGFAVRSWRDGGLMALIGAMMALYQVCYFAAIARVGVAIAVLVTLCVAPVLVALLGGVVLRERLTATVAGALACALGGTALLVLGQPEAMQAPANALGGVLLALGSALGYAVMTLCSRQLAARYHALTPITVGFTVGALALLPFALLDGLVLHYPSVNGLPAGWLLLVYLGLVPTALAYALFLRGMRTTSATVASIVTLLEPLTSTALAWLIFGERFGPLGLVGGALLLGAIFLLVRR